MSDDTALGIALSQIYDKDSVYIHIMHGDITARKGGDPQNIVGKIGNDVRYYAKSQHYTAKHFKRIIHIVDTDGAYIPDGKVIDNQDCQNPRYESDGIYTKDVKGIISRNKQKRDNLYRLRSCGSIWNIPYRVYYMSCNLDHVLYDKRNSTDEEKEKDAYAFAKRYKNDCAGFVKFICESAFSVNGSYSNLWKHIEKSSNSIERYTNLSICIEEEIKHRETGVNFDLIHIHNAILIDLAPYYYAEILL